MTDTQRPSARPRYPFPEQAVIGVLHLKPLPGSPRYGGDPDAVREACLADARALIEGGVDGLILENYGDTPFLPGAVEPHTVAFMAVMLAEIASLTDLPLGVNVLRNDGESALAVALAAGARFIRVNVLTGAAVTDQGVISGRAHAVMRYRANLGLQVAVLADVHVKHASPLGSQSLEDAARDAYHRGGAEALILTGPATGKALDIAHLKRVRSVLPDAPLIAGSGVTDESLEAIFRVANGAIVGTWFKEGGETGAPVDPDRVKRLMKIRDGIPR